ncbi:MAG: hypothetical protein CMJ59_08700 [Planctomycetaceae bacterium]|nr:hypothetical protein [Planctomycetaceae bacterium]
MKCVGLVLMLLAVFQSNATGAESYWNQYRGPNGDGKAATKNLPVEFTEAKNVRWKIPIAGEGWSSPVVWGNEIWLTIGSDERKELRAICVDLDSGRVVKDIKVFDMIERQVVEAYKHDSPHLNSPATPTSVVEEKRVFVHFGSQGIACLDRTTGDKIWERRDLRVYQPVRQGSSPIVDDKCLYVAYDGTDQQFFVALDKETGETRWKKHRKVETDWEATLRARGFEPKQSGGKPDDNKKAFATATLIEVSGQRQLIAPAAEATIAYDPEKGEEIWRVLHPGGFNVAARPLFAHGMVYVFTSGLTGYLLAVRVDGTGDVTDTHVAWSTTRGTPHIPSPVIVDDLMFTVTDRGGIARCLDARTGQEVWKKRLGGDHWASPLYANGKLYFSSKQGAVDVLVASRGEPDFLARNKLDASFIASPAVAGDSMILRSTTHLYCIAEGYQRTAEQVAATSRKQQKQVKAVQKPKGQTDLTALATRLKKAVAAGKITEKDAKAKYDAAAANQVENRKPVADQSKDDSHLAALGARLKELVSSGKLTKQEAIQLFELAGGNKSGENFQATEAIDLETLAAELKQAVDDGKMTVEEAKAKYARVAARQKKGKVGAKTKGTVQGKKKRTGKGRKTADGRAGFYAIVIGRLKAKDVELGVFTLEVDHVTSMYENRWVKDEIVGKTVQVTGVSGQFLDSLLLIKRGETLKFRSGSYAANSNSLAFGPKFHVLERTAPFDPAAFGVPPEKFRGFSGVLSGEIVELDQGYELLLRVDKVVKLSGDSKATDADSIKGKLVRLNGFYTQHQDLFNDLGVGDTIRVGTRHANRTHDELGVTDVLTKIEK